MTNVDQFSFPVDLTTFRTRHGREHLEKVQTRRYSGTTCDIVNAMQTAVDDYTTTYPSGPPATWSQIVVNDAAGTDSLTLVDSADLSGDTVTINDSIIDGVTGLLVLR